MHSTVIIVPCYNEASRLDPAAFLDACRAQPALSFVFVNDGSTDTTAELLSSLAAELPAQISTLTLEVNCGKAEAVRRGVLHAFASPARLIGYWDADLATPLDNIERFAEFFEAASGIQIVMGSRVRLLGRDIRRTWLRHYVGRCFATLASFALNLTVYDTQCGAKLFRSSETFREVFAHPFELGWSFDVEMLLRFLTIARRQGSDPATQIVEVPLASWVDVAGSKIRPSHLPRIAWDMAKLVALSRES